MKNQTMKKIMKGVIITALALAIAIGGTGSNRKPGDFGKGDNHITYTQK